MRPATERDYINYLISGKITPTCITIKQSYPLMIKTIYGMITPSCITQGVMGRVIPS